MQSQDGQNVEKQVEQGKSQGKQFLDYCIFQAIESTLTQAAPTQHFLNVLYF